MARKYDRRFGKWYQEIFEVLLPQVSLNDTILEIGCGSGLLSFEIIPNVDKFVGYDLSQKMIDVCKTKLENLGYKNASFIKGDANNPPSLGIFDKILIVNLLHVLDQPQDVLFQLKRNLTANTQLLILSYCHGEKMKFRYGLLSFLMHIGSKLGLMATLHRFTFEELKELIEQSGFELIKEIKHTEGFPFLFVIAKQQQN